jgi:death-on-curing protein
MRREPVWLLRDTILAIHRRQIAEHGGPDGIRDERLLDATLARPLQLWAYRRPKPDIPALGAAFASTVVRSHPFIDGNKRTGYIACRLFLRLNGYDLAADLGARYVAVLRLADGSIDEAAFERWVRQGSTRIGGLRR